MKKILILGAAGFLGQHLEYRMKEEGHYVFSVARKHPPYRKSVANTFSILDLTNTFDFHSHFFRHRFDECFQMAGSVGGLGYIGNSANDAEILTNSTKINLHTLEAIRKANTMKWVDDTTLGCGKIFFASSQCVYPDVFDIDPFSAERLQVYEPRKLREIDARFDHNFAFAQEKLYAESLYRAYADAYGIAVRIGRLGNCYGPYCEWRDPKSKAVAAICRKVVQADYGGVVRLWGDGQQSRSFTYVGDAVEGIIRLMASDYDKPVNIASPETVTITQLFEFICQKANRILAWESEPGPVGVSSRSSDNTICREILDWEPPTQLLEGLVPTYEWVAKQAVK